MRIDYSEPKHSSVSGHSKARPRKEPVGFITAALLVAAVAIFAVGFATGWLLSQRSAKKSFQAAMQQKSLENSMTQAAPSVQASKPQPQPPAGQQPAQAPGASPQAPTQTMPEPPLSFYKTLPSGQKSTVLGSGINSGEDKKAPLQAAIPANVARPTQAPAETAKVPATPAARTGESNGFTVQVASYSLKSEAEAMKAKLAGKGYNVNIVESNQGDKGTWYRVRVGRRLEQDAAKELAAKIGKGAIPIPDKD